ncbi:hypothetical protein Tco_0898100 [Tanacetum coccineum]
MPSVLYQNFLREFWCTAIAYDPILPEDDSEERPLKEYKIKFTVMNGNKSLTLDFKTFVEATGFDYNQGAYVSHPSHKAMKAELAKIATDEVISRNYSSTEQINSIQQMIAYCLITGTKVDIGERALLLRNNSNLLQRSLCLHQKKSHMDKEEQIKKATKEAKMFEMTKTEVIKVVQVEAEKIILDPKTIISVKACEKFKKAQDTEHQVLKREHSQKVKRLIELNKKRGAVHGDYLQQTQARTYHKF